jgi:hypothetical protein
MSFSSFRPVSDAGKELKQLADQLLTQKVDSKLQKALQNAIVELDHSLAEGSSMSTMFRAAEKVVHMVDVIGAIDAEFVLDQLEELNADKKNKKASMSQYIFDKSRTLDVAGAAAAASATISAAAISATTSTSSSQTSTDTSDDESLDIVDREAVKQNELGAIEALAQQHHENRSVGSHSGRPLSGNPFGPITMIDPYGEGVQNNELGAIAALGQQMRENRALTAGSLFSGGMPGLIDGKLTIGGHMLALIESFSPEELMEQLMGILENGIDDVSDLTQLLKILGELGANIPQELLVKIKEAIGDFLSEAMATTGSMTEFLVLLQQLQAMAGDLGSDIMSEIGDGSQLMSMFGEGNMTEGDKMMAEGMGLAIEEESGPSDSFESTGDPMNEEMQLMQEMDEFASDLTGISVEGSFAQAAAGAQQTNATRPLTSQQRTSSLDPTQRVESMTGAQGAGDTLMGDAVSALQDIVKSVLDFVHQHRDEFGDQVRDFVASYMENDILDKLDTIKT